MGKPASDLTKAVMKKLNKAGIFAWTQNNTPIFDPKLNHGYGAYRSHGSLKGVPDIICILAGQFVGIEIKAGKDRLSADQLLFKKRCERSGGKYIVARSVDDVDNLLQKA